MKRVKTQLENLLLRAWIYTFLTVNEILRPKRG